MKSTMAGGLGDGSYGGWLSGSCTHRLEELESLVLFEISFVGMTTCHQDYLWHYSKRKSGNSFILA